MRMRADGFDYKAGAYALTRYDANSDGHSVTVRIQNRQGKLTISDRNVVVRLITESGVVQANGMESKGIVIRQLSSRGKE